MSTGFRNVVVLGAAYGGARAATVLAENLPAGYRIILIDRNSHANHLYVLPRLGVLSGHEHKAFIPYTNVFNAHASSSSAHQRHIFLHARVMNMNSHSVVLDRSFPELGFDSGEIPFDYAVYALGSHLPAPIDLWASEPPHLSIEGADGSLKEQYGGTKAEGMKWLTRSQERISASSNVLVVGGGALGIQFATDIASIHPDKHVTLLHSRHHLLPRFDLAMHTEIMRAMDDLHIDVILGERLDISSTRHGSEKFDALTGHRIVRTVNGREIAADLILLCTGQIPNTALLRRLCPKSVNPDSGLAHVLRTLQLGILSQAPRMSYGIVPHGSGAPENTSLPEGGDSDDELDLGASSEDLARTEEDAEPEAGTDLGDRVEKDSEKTTPFPHIFVIGDAADAFGAINAGHNAYYQGEVAARNIVGLIKRRYASDLDNSDEDLALEDYTPGLPAIKLTLGLGKSLYEINGEIGHKEGEAEDLDAASVWRYFGMVDVKEEEMFA